MGPKMSVNLVPNSRECVQTHGISYGLCEPKNKQCGSCMLTTKNVITNNYYDRYQKDNLRNHIC